MENKQELALLDPKALGTVVEQLIKPLTDTMAAMLSQTQEALMNVAQSQKIMSDRMEALERKVRLNTLITPVQERYLKAEVKRRAMEVLSKRGLDGDKRYVTAIGNGIRKAVLSRYGIGALRDLPQHEYGVAMSQIGTWNDQMLILSVSREARQRAQTEAERSGGYDGERSSGLLEE